MIKQLSKQKSFIPKSSPKWVDESDAHENIFEPRSALRKMIIMVDSELLIDNRNFNKDFVFSGLLVNKFIEFYKYSDKGPPSNLPPLQSEYLRKSEEKVYEGWATLYPKEENMDLWQVTYANEGNWAFSAIQGNSPKLAYEDERYHVYPSLNLEDQKQQRKADILALKVAEEALNADIFITKRPYLYSDSLIVKNKGITLCYPDEAIPLISLYLRTQNQFIFPTGHRNYTISYGRKWLFYWVGTRELLPEAWRWFSACLYHSKGINNDNLQLLAGSLLNRVCRALQSRDSVHLAINQPTYTDTIEDALNSLDNTLTLLMGAVDVSARVANYILNVTTTQSEVGWQKGRWYKQICKVDTNMKSLFPNNSDNKNTLTILRLLRNSVHGEALQGIKTSLERNETNMLIGIPSDDVKEIIEAMDALGGKESWGFKPTIPGRNLIEPGVLLDKLFELAVNMLNEIMKVTPVEKLPNLDLNNITYEPFVKDKKGFDDFSEESRKNIRWQLGF